MNISTHQQYTYHLRKWLPKVTRTPADAEFIRRRLWQIQILLALNLDPARDPLRTLYCPKPRGQKPRNPIAILRALLVMWMEGASSLDAWVHKLKEDQRLTVLCGFYPDCVPGVGTFYAFMDRLETGPYETRKKGVVPRDSECYRRTLGPKPKRNEPESDGAGETERQRLLQEQDQPREEGLQTFLEDLLFRVGLPIAWQAGLFPEDGQLNVSGDVTALRAGASRWGRPTCTCRAQGIYKCQCPRDYTDELADWGWSSQLKCIIFGYHLYLLTINVGGHDLILHISIGSARETDHTLSLKALQRLRMLIKAFELDKVLQVSTFISDSGADGEAVYVYLHDQNIRPVIALNQRRSLALRLSTGEEVDANGRVFCPGGVPMTHLGFDSSRERHIFGCPAKIRHRENGRSRYVVDLERCPRAELCQPDTATGPNRCLPIADDLRLLPQIPRGSAQYTKLKNQRSGIERQNSFLKVAHCLEHFRARRWTHILIHSYLVAIIGMVQASIDSELVSLSSTDDPLAMMEALIAA